jgi:hypothetical protein
MALKTDAGERRTPTVREVAAILGLGRNEAYNAIRRGDIVAITDRCINI